MSSRRRTFPRPPQPERSSSELRPYRQPRLDRLGDLRSLTLGTSPGAPDSGIGMPDQRQPM